MANNRTRPARRAVKQAPFPAVELSTQPHRGRRYVVVSHSAAPGTGKCYECGEEDYTQMIVDNFFHGNTGDDEYLDKASIVILCARCVHRLAVEMLEATGL